MPKLLTQGVSLKPKTGRQLIGIVAGFKSERWPVIDRNDGRLHVGIRIKVISSIASTGYFEFEFIVPPRHLRSGAFEDIVAAKSRHPNPPTKNLDSRMQT